MRHLAPPLGWTVSIARLRMLPSVTRGLLFALVAFVGRLGRLGGGDVDRELIRWVLTRQFVALEDGLLSHALVRFEGRKLIVNNRALLLQGDRELALVRELVAEAKRGTRFVPALELASRMRLSTDPAHNSEAKNAVEKAVCGIRRLLQQARLNRNLIETAPKTDGEPNHRSGLEGHLGLGDKARGYRLPVPALNIDWDLEER